VRAVAFDAPFLDIGTPADYMATSLAFARTEAPAETLQPVALVGARATIAPSARLIRTILWDDVEVGDEVSLTDCIVADGVRVPPGARWSRRVIVPAGCCEPRPGDTRLGDLLLAPIDR
jgi:NDP-sugar pyrophosphorylase family protein